MNRKGGERFNGFDAVGFRSPKPFTVELGQGGRVIIPEQKEPKYRPGEQTMRAGMSRKEARRAQGR